MVDEVRRLVDHAPETASGSKGVICNLLERLTFATGRRYDETLTQLALTVKTTAVEFDSSGALESLATTLVELIGESGLMAPTEAGLSSNSQTRSDVTTFHVSRNAAERLHNETDHAMIDSDDENHPWGNPTKVPPHGVFHRSASYPSNLVSTAVSGRVSLFTADLTLELQRMAANALCGEITLGAQEIKGAPTPAFWARRLCQTTQCLVGEARFEAILAAQKSAGTKRLGRVKYDFVNNSCLRRADALMAFVCHAPGISADARILWQIVKRLLTQANEDSFVDVAYSRMEKLFPEVLASLPDSCDPEKLPPFPELSGEARRSTVGNGVCFGQPLVELAPFMPVFHGLPWNDPERTFLGIPFVLIVHRYVDPRRTIELVGAMLQDDRQALLDVFNICKTRGGVCPRFNAFVGACHNYRQDRFSALSCPRELAIAANRLCPSTSQWEFRAAEETIDALLAHFRQSDGVQVMDPLSRYTPEIQEVLQSLRMPEWVPYSQNPSNDVLILQ